MRRIVAALVACAFLLSCATPRGQEPPRPQDAALSTSSVQVELPPTLPATYGDARDFYCYGAGDCDVNLLDGQAPGTWCCRPVSTMVSPTGGMCYGLSSAECQGDGGGGASPSGDSGGAAAPAGPSFDCLASPEAFALGAALLLLFVAVLALVACPVDASGRPTFCLGA